MMEQICQVHVYIYSIFMRHLYVDHYISRPGNVDYCYAKSAKLTSPDSLFKITRCISMLNFAPLSSSNNCSSCTSCKKEHFGISGMGVLQVSCPRCQQTYSAIATAGNSNHWSSQEKWPTVLIPSLVHHWTPHTSGAAPLCRLSVGSILPQIY